MKRYGWLRLLIYLSLSTSASLKSSGCPKPCNMPLGLANGLIKDEQLSSFSAYNDDFATYGAHRARLNLTKWPPGYRARNSFLEKLPWIRIDLRKELTITGIATQGYGDASVAEWVTSYRLMYADKLDFVYFVDIHGNVLGLRCVSIHDGGYRLCWIAAILDSLCRWTLGKSLTHSQLDDRRSLNLDTEGLISDKIHRLCRRDLEGAISLYNCNCDERTEESRH